MPFKACCQVSSVRGRGIERNFQNRGICLARKDRAQLYQVRSNTRHVHMEGSIVNGQGGDGTGSSKLVLTLRNGLGAKRVGPKRKKGQVSMQFYESAGESHPDKTERTVPLQCVSVKGHRSRVPGMSEHHSGPT